MFFFALSHGVHRGILRPGKTDEREIFIKKLKSKCKEISFESVSTSKTQCKQKTAIQNVQRLIHIIYLYVHTSIIKVTQLSHDVTAS